MELIDRIELRERLENRYCKSCKENGKDYNGVRCRACAVGDELDDIDDSFVIDPFKVANRTGAWIEENRWIDGYGKMRMTIRCSNCNGNVQMTLTSNFPRHCEWCGSKNGAD